MTLMYLLVDSEPKSDLVRTMKDLFRNWGDQVAAQDGDGRIVSMWYVSRLIDAKLKFCGKLDDV